MGHEEPASAILSLGDHVQRRVQSHEDPGGRPGSVPSLEACAVPLLCQGFGIEATEDREPITDRRKLPRRHGAVAYAEPCEIPRRSARGWRPDDIREHFAERLARLLPSLPQKACARSRHVADSSVMLQQPRSRARSSACSRSARPMPTPREPSSTIRSGIHAWGVVKFKRTRYSMSRNPTTWPPSSATRATASGRPR
jgi:hypothetical protein